MPDSKQQIRSEMRRRRKALTPTEQARAADNLARIITRQFFFLRSKRLAFYLANDGEIDPGLLLRLAFMAGKNTYLPALHPLSSRQL